ncbi:MAG TPA: UbiA family prenyltransferase [Anaerolineae bacterium]|nr:UbiA family prenyltransferase [Anaerolineae bacterium]
MTLNRKVKGVIQLFRPELPLAAGLCVIIGELLALGTIPPLRELALGFACGFFLSGSALISNDYFDLEVDRINAPQRPLPAGLLSPTEVLVLSFVTAFVGLVAALALSPLALVFSLIVWMLGFLYNWKLKAAGLAGNLIVSTSVAMTFVLGGIGTGQVWNKTVWTFAVFAFFFDLAEEIAGDAMDAEGDQKRGSRSIAIRRGKQAALRLAGLIFGVVMVVSFMPLVWGEVRLPYLLIISLTDALILFFVRSLLKSRTPAEGRRAMRGAYLSASLGLLAFLVSAFFP